MSNSKRNTHMMKATLGATVITILFSLLTYVLFMSLQPFFFVQAQNATDNIQANKSEISIPSTISKKSQEILKSLRSREPTFVAPGPDDAKGWQKLNQQIIPLLQKTQPAVDSYHPNITVSELGDVNVLDIKPRDWRDNGKVLVYLHGGGYTLLSANSTLGYCSNSGQFYRT